MPVRLWIIFCVTLLAPDAKADVIACPEITTPPASICISTTHGLAYANTKDDARLGAEALDAAVTRFERAFSQTLPPGVLVLSTAFGSEDAKRLADAHGMGFALSWLPPAAKRAQVEAVLRRAMPDADPSKIEAALSDLVDQHVDTLQHELGHALYRAAFWPQSESSTRHYGSPAPDWLDEAAALLLEGASLRQQRETLFLDTLRQASPGMLPLADFLAMEHPVTAQARARMLDQGGAMTASGVQVMAATGADANRIALFYAQSLAFAEFLIEASAEPDILGAISIAASGGTDFVDWLAAASTRYGLPATLPALQAAWNAWCGKRRAAAQEPAA